MFDIFPSMSLILKVAAAQGNVPITDILLANGADPLHQVD